MDRLAVTRKVDSCRLGQIKLQASNLPKPHPCSCGIKYSQMKRLRWLIQNNLVGGNVFIRVNPHKHLIRTRIYMHQ
jgi:hypothetical protein